MVSPGETALEVSVPARKSTTMKRSGDMTQPGTPTSPTRKNSKNAHLAAVAFTYPEYSLLCIRKSSLVRRYCILLTHSPIFENFILACILCNSVTLGLSSNRQDFNQTLLGRILNKFEYVWVAIFTVEALLKIVSMGFLLAPGTYLRDGWNLVDFLVVALGYVDIFTSGNMTALRTVRVLRPLRAITRVRGMKVLVTTLIASMPMLIDVMLLCAFTFFVWGIIAVQLFAGALRNRCGEPNFDYAVATPLPGGAIALSNVSYMVSEDFAGDVCSGPLASYTSWTTTQVQSQAAAGLPPLPSPPGPRGGGRVCEASTYCTLYGNPNYGITSFDNILWAWLTIFQCITLESWTDVMYFTQDGVSWWVWPFFVALVVFGAFFLVSLALAVLFLQFSAENQETHREEAHQREMRRAEAEKQQRQRQRQQRASSDSAAGGGGGSGSEVESEAGAGAGAARASTDRSCSVVSTAGGSSGVAGSAASAVSAGAGAGARGQQRRSEEGEGLQPVQSGPLPLLTGEEVAALPPLRRTAHRLAESRWLTATTITVILVNTAVMCVNWYGMPYSVESATTYINYGLTVYFVVEVAIRLTAYGFIRYFRDGMNVFDFVVVVVSVSEIIVDLVPTVAGLGPLSVLRMLRLLRVFRLARSWRELAVILAAVLQSVSSTAYLLMLMGLFMLIAALMGMQLFGYRFMFCDYVAGASPVCPLGQAVWGGCPNHFYCYLPCSDEQYGNWIDAPGSFYNDLAYCDRFCDAAGAASAAATTGAEGNTTTSTISSTSAGGGCEYLAMVGKSQVPRANFDNVLWAMYTVFQLLTGENWNNVMYDSIRTSSPWAALYFVGVILIGTYLVFNLFIAILLDNFTGAVDIQGPSRDKARDNDPEDADPWDDALELESSANPKGLPPPQDTAAAAAALGPTASTHPWRLEAEKLLLQRKESGTDSERGSEAPDPGVGDPRVGGAARGHTSGWGAGSGDGRDQGRGGGGAMDGRGGGADLDLTASGRIASWYLEQYRSVESADGASGRGAAGGGDSSSLLADRFSADKAQEGEGQEGEGQGRKNIDGTRVRGAAAAGTGAAPPGDDEAAKPRGTGSGLLFQSEGAEPTTLTATLPGPALRPAAAASTAAPGEAGPGPGPGSLRGRTSLPGAWSFGSRERRRVVPLGPADLAAGPPPRGQSAATATAAGSRPLSAVQPQLGAPAAASRAPSLATWAPPGKAARGAAVPACKAQAVKPPPRLEPSSSTLSTFSSVSSSAASDASAAGASAGKQPAGGPASSTTGPNTAIAATKSTTTITDSGGGGSARWWWSRLSRLRLLPRATSSLRSFRPSRHLAALIKGRALLLLGPDHWLRWRAAWLVHNRHFEAVILLLILASSVCLTLDTPSLDPHSRLAFALRLCDYIFTAAFTLEAVLKIVAFGFALTGRHAYARSGWNLLDLGIVLLGWALIIVEVVGLDQSNLHMLRVLRTLRALRPLRAVSRYEGLRVVVTALFAVLPAMANVALVCLLFYVIFAILAVNLFKGKLFNCIDAASGERIDPFYVMPYGQQLTRSWCEAGSQTITQSAYYSAINVTMPEYTINTQWVNLRDNFDNVGIAMLTLFQVASLELWVDVAFSAVDAVGVGRQPLWNHSPAVLLFFVLFIVVCSFFVLNLFVGVTLEKVSELQREQMSSSVFVTAQQSDWVEVQKLLLRTSMQRRPPAPEGPRWRLVLFEAVSSAAFGQVVLMAIVANTVLMALVHVDMSEGFQAVMSYSNLVFTCIFVAEAALKLIAFGPLGYFRDGWNCFDCFVAAASAVSVALDFSGTRNLSFMPVLRVLRVVRVVRLIKRAAGMQRLLMTLVHSLPALVNVGGIMLLFFFMFAVIGMNLFGDMVYGDFLNRHANFNNFPSAMLVLVRILTGESWGGIMMDCMTTRDCVRVTTTVTLNTTATPPTAATLIPGGTYLDPSDPLLPLLPANATDNQCALSPAVAAIYFPVFVVLCAFIMLNLVIAVILENMVVEEADEALPVSRSMVGCFVDAWSAVDPTASGVTHASKLPLVIAELEPPLGTKGVPSRTATQAVIMSVDIPVHANNQVTFLETLHALSGRLVGCELPDIEEERLTAKYMKRLPGRGAAAFPKYTAAHFHAALHVKAAVQGFLARQWLRQREEEQQGLTGGKGAEAGTGAAAGTGTGKGAGPGS